MSDAADGRSDCEDPRSAQMRAVQACIAALRSGQGDRYALPFAESRTQLLRERQWWLEDGPVMASVTDQWLDCGSGPIRLRRYEPGLATGSLVYLHGGGWCVGSVDTHDAVIRHLARASGRVAIGIDYPLAPEAPFPAALEALDAALTRLTDDGQLTDDWVLAGDSAGAHLALLLTLAARTRTPSTGWSLPAALLLFYGVYFPLRPTSSLQRFGGGDFGLTKPALDRYQSAFLAGRTPEAVPEAFIRVADLHMPAGGPGVQALPPLWLAAAALDPLLDDTLALAEALSAVAARHRLTVYPGVIHGFLSYTRMLDVALTAFTDAAAFIAEPPAPRVDPIPR